MKSVLYPILGHTARTYQAFPHTSLRAQADNAHPAGSNTSFTSSLNKATGSFSSILSTIANWVRSTLQRPGQNSPAAFSSGQTANQTAEHTRSAAFAITSAFEGGQPGTIQTVDDGIISYGSHQATLRSGQLENVIDRFVSVSTSETASTLASFANRIRIKDESLAADLLFLELLRAAASEPEMKTVQDEVFAANYYVPAMAKAESIGLATPLATAIFYDTAVQGGLNRIISRTENLLADQKVDEATYLRTFLLERRAYLNEVAETKFLAGKLTQASMLSNSAQHRVGALLELLASGNLQIALPITVLGHQIRPLDLP